MLLKGTTFSATPDTAIVRWKVHKEISSFDMDHFELTVYKEGSNEHYTQLRDVISKSDNNVNDDVELIFIDKEINPGDPTDPTRAYKLQGLEPATVYTIKLIMTMPTIRGCMNNYKAKGMHIPEDPEKPGSYKPLEHTFPLLTSQKPIDDFVEEELDMAQSIQRPRHRKVTISNSERTLGLYSAGQPDMESLIGNRHEVMANVLAARNSKNWLDFAHTPLTEFGSSHSSKACSQRVARYVLVGQAQAALEGALQDNDAKEPDREENEFLSNKWGMGPFYSYNHNYDKLLDDANKRKRLEARLKAEQAKEDDTGPMF